MTPDKTLDLRERVVTAAIEEFETKGLKFTMDDVSKNLGISKKTLYTVYDNKEEMLLALADYVFAEIKASERAILADESLDTVEKIGKILVVLPDRYQNIGFTNLYALKDKYPSIYQRVGSYLENDWDATIDLIKKGMDEGKIRKISIPVLKAMVEGAFEQFLSTTILVDSNVKYEDALEEMINIIMNGIKK